jgi:type IV pilus assembly protein PilY1
MLISKLRTLNIFRRYLTAFKQLGIGFGVAGLTFGISFSTEAAPVQYPLFIANPVKPIMMLNMSKDHQLFYKLYDDYSDIVDMRANLPTSSSASSVSSSSSSAATNPNFGKSGKDGRADITYIHVYRYYGYFDSDKCYTYASGLFTPSRFVDSSTRYCNYSSVTNEWNGNFLNWATMTRLDAVRKILYGGKRAVDTESETVLERAFLPEDAHAFAKYYNGTDIARLTPFTTSQVTGGTNTKTSGITICNATSPANDTRATTDAKGRVTSTLKSQEVSANSSIHPLLKVAKGNFSLWGSNEGFQCRWGVGSNDNVEAETGIKAYDASPIFADHKLGNGDYSVRVKVCVSNLMNDANEEGCKRYDSGHSKPIGLLQEYGERDTIHFALLTGSYGKNKSGGALRKNAGTMTDEIDLTTGQIINPYKNPSDTSLGRKDSIIRALNALTIYGYDYSNGQYNSADNCAWGLSGFENGSCTNWGNPQSELYLESLRYLAGRSAAFEVDDSAKVTGFSTATWAAPVGSNNYCAPLNILQFNASTSSYDTDELNNLSQIGISDLDALVNNIGTAESISGQYFVGIAAAAGGDELCTPKTVTNLSTVKGTCPDAPRLKGGYHIAGLAYGARKDGIPINGLSSRLNGKDIDNTPSVHTYAVALAPAVPKVEVPVPGSTSKQITILPACRNTNTNPNANCAIVDFKIVAQSHTGSTYTGTLYVDWEDSEQGGDYDQDMWGLLKYTVTASNVKVETRVFAQATDHKLGFGYVIGGTTRDGFNVQSGVNDFRYGTYCAAANSCTCRTDAAFDSCTESNWKEQNFSVADNASVKLLELPLYYAAKWGGYANDNATATDIRNGGASTFYYATDPRQLAASLRNAFNSIAEREGSSSGVATNSTSLNGSSYLYQAVFNSTNWQGSLDAFAFDGNGRLVRNLDSKGNLIPAVTTDTVQPTPSARTIYTYRRGDGTVNYQWSTLSTTQKDYFRASTDAIGNYTNAQKRFNWSLGYATDEVTTAAAGIDRLRSRGTGTSRNIYGDIVNSTPVYIANTNYRHHKLSSGGSTYAAYLTAKASKTAKVAVGANDGMLHVFNARTLAEMYAYVPNLVYPKLRNLSAQNYGRSTNPHQYLIDGPLTVGDVYNGTSWRTIVVGTLGGGGRGVFALDVTDDTSPRVLFEISDADFPQLGYVLGKPIIAPLKNGRWGVIFGNGDSSGSSTITAQSHLFVVDIYDPLGQTKIIPTNAGKGLSAPAVLPDANGMAKTVYAGDLNGQLWKFDLNSSDEDDWEASYKLFHAKTADSTAKEQPITAAPTLGINNAKGGKIAVYFGTGKYFEAGDHATSSSNPYHSFYAITDIGSTVERDDLVEKTFNTARRVVEPSINWTEKDGWYLDLGITNEERVIAKTLLIAGRLVFATIIPSASSCDNGGTSWLLETAAVYPGGSDDSDDSDENGPPPYEVLKDPPSEGVMTLAPIGLGVTDDELTLLIGRSDGNPDDEAGNQPIKSTGRQSWRELD